MIKKIRNSYLVSYLLPKLKNKYAITLLGFIVWISFFDRNDWISQHSYKNQLNKLKDEKKYYVDEISKNRKDLNDLISNPNNLEKFARERYLMKKNGEDIFIFVKETQAPDNQEGKN